MRFAVDYNENRVSIDETQSNMEYYCPYCGATLITRKGEIRQHHFAHKSTHFCKDTWERSGKYDISPWHNEWQDCFPKQNQEIKLQLGDTIHRADVMIDKTVIEFQHSIISPQSFDNRNNFYLNFGLKVVWLFDVSDLIKEGKIEGFSCKAGFSFSWKNPKKTFNGYDVKYGNVEIFFQLTDDKEVKIVRIADVSDKGFEEFFSDAVIGKNEFLDYVGLSEGECLLPEREDIQKNENYKRFKEKYNINLNRQQERALLAINGSVLLLAVPGSGKTTVLVNRLGYMVLERKIDPSEILAITFNKVAAEEMKSRFNSKFSASIHGKIAFKTINSLSLEIYTDFCKETGREIRKLIDDKETRRVLLNLYNKYNSDNDNYASESDILDMISVIAYIKNMQFSDEQIQKLNEEIPHIAEIYIGYQDYLKKNKLMDFNDQMVYAHAILVKYKDVLLRLRNKYKYICVDEAQDTSKIQHAIIHMLADGNSLFMVGDEDQSIYGFRAAYPKALLNFRYDYHNPYILKMERNYRSTPQIVNMAQQFISANKGRYEKHMVSERTGGDDIKFIIVGTREEQFNQILKEANNFNNDTAILYRDNESAVALVHLFLENNIDFVLKRPEMNFFNSKIVREIIAYLKLTVNPFDADSFNLICNKGIIYLKKQQKDYAVKNVKLKGITVFEAVYEQMKFLKKSDQHRASHFKLIMNEVKGKTTYEAINLICALGYEEYLKDNYIDSGKLEILKMIAKSKSDIKQFIDYMIELEHKWKNGFVTDNNNAVVLSTIHSSKGMEYDKVFIVDVYDGRFPSSAPDFISRSKDNANGEQEERRLFYVGVTRAKNELTLFRIADKNSEFLKEIRSSASRNALSVIDARPKQIEEKRQNTVEYKPLRTYNKQIEKTDDPHYPAKAEASVFYKTENTGKYRLEKGFKEVCDQFIQQDTQIIDSFGQRWIRCEICGKIKPTDEFSLYGGPGKINSGTCRECAKE